MATLQQFCSIGLGMLKTRKFDAVILDLLENNPQVMTDGATLKIQAQRRLGREVRRQEFRMHMTILNWREDVHGTVRHKFSPAQPFYSISRKGSARLKSLQTQKGIAQRLMDMGAALGRKKAAFGD